MITFKIGDEVRVLMRMRRRGTHVPADGYQGTVTKIGRKYATAVFTETWTDQDGSPGSREYEINFDMETGTVRADAVGWYVRTPEQLEQAERRKMALFLLSERGIEIKMGYANSLALEQIEALSEVVKSWED